MCQSLNLTGSAHLSRPPGECSRLTRAGIRGEQEFHLWATNPHVSHTQSWDFPVPARVFWVHGLSTIKTDCSCSSLQKGAPLSSRRLQAGHRLPRKAGGLGFVSQRDRSLSIHALLYILKNRKDKYASPPVPAGAAGLAGRGGERGRALLVEINCPHSVQKAMPCLPRGC